MQTLQGRRSSWTRAQSLKLPSSTPPSPGMTLSPGPLPGPPSMPPPLLTTCNSCCGYTPQTILCFWFDGSLPLPYGAMGAIHPIAGRPTYAYFGSRWFTSPIKVSNQIRYMCSILALEASNCIGEHARFDDSGRLMMHIFCRRGGDSGAPMLPANSRINQAELRKLRAVMHIYIYIAHRGGEEIPPTPGIGEVFITSK